MRGKLVYMTAAATLVVSLALSGCDPPQDPQVIQTLIAPTPTETAEQTQVLPTATLYVPTPTPTATVPPTAKPDSQSNPFQDGAIWLRPDILGAEVPFTDQGLGTGQPTITTWVSSTGAFIDAVRSTPVSDCPGYYDNIYINFVVPPKAGDEITFSDYYGLNGSYVARDGSIHDVAQFLSAAVARERSQNQAFSRTYVILTNGRTITGMGSLASGGIEDFVWKAVDAHANDALGGSTAGFSLTPTTTPPLPECRASYWQAPNAIALGYVDVDLGMAPLGEGVEVAAVQDPAAPKPVTYSPGPAQDVAPATNRRQAKYGWPGDFLIQE